jgi:S-DNA-T family DNA segregation ATPase FtsK/SpoIIIE
VVEVDKAVSVLQGIVREMDRRYLAFANTGVRNIDGYNRLPARTGREKMPYIILVVDELADLMMLAAEQVERMICRLAQMARATGIHVVIATQRPSVDVVTGLIKANFPARISFAVTSQIDSRVILDMGGAEKLLGRGDMLYMASDSSKVVRLQGSFVSDEELKRIVDFWKAQSAGVAVPLPGAGTIAPWMEEQPEEEDPLLQQAITVVRSSGRASVSLLQRKLRIGYARAARLMDIMEEQGIVKPSEDGRSREVQDDADDPDEADKDGEEGR